MGRTKLDLSQISGIGNLTFEEQLVKIEENNSKVIVFVIPGDLKVGVQKAEIRFPFQGIIEQVYASCSTPGSSESVIEIEKCTQDFIDGINTTDDWTNVLSTNLTIEMGKRSSNASTNPAVIATPDVGLNDHFRLNVIQAGDLKDLTVEVKIKI